MLFFYYFRTGSPSVSFGEFEQESENSSIIDVQLQSNLPQAIARILPGSGRYQILYTDYDNFAILWSCSSYRIAHTGKNEEGVKI